MRGKLFVCATPIGNLSDVSERLRQVLSEVDVIFSECPERSLKLLNHLGLRKPIRKYHERDPMPALRRLEAGQKVALLSSAGAPGVSDPGRELIRLCYQLGIEVVGVPGPSALCLAMSYAPFRTTPLTFGGFPPRKGKDRSEYLRNLLSLREHAILLFESPRRVRALISELSGICEELGQERELLILRELTKLNESVTLTSLPLATKLELPERGEYTLLLSAVT